MDGKGELRFIEVVEKTGEREVKVRVFPQFRLGLNGIQNFLYNYPLLGSEGAWRLRRLTYNQR